MNKVVKRILKIVGIAIAVIVVVLIGYIIYLYASYHRIEDNKKLKVESRIEQSKASEKLSTGKEYSALTYNIGFGAYTPDFSFFMDGGKSSWAKSKKSVISTVNGAGKLVKSYDPDFVLIEEVDLNSTRSYHVNEYSLLKNVMKDYDCVFAQNYDSAFLFYPFTQPHGSSKSGLALFSKYSITDSLRRSFPVSTSFSKFFDLDRCYSISRVPVDNGKEFVIFELHMSAYGNSDESETSIGCRIRGIKDGKEHTYYVYNNCKHQEAYKETGMQGVSYTTGVPAMIGAMMFFKGLWRKPGVWNVEDFDPDPFMEQLNKQGLPWNEVFDGDLEL